MRKRRSGSHGFLLSVTLHSLWTRENDKTKWVIVALWNYEQGERREVRAVTLNSVEVKTRVRHLSQARLLGTMREVK